MLRVWNIPFVNWLVLLLYVFNLCRLSLRFKSLYAVFPLGATALTNLLLFGLSDSLAQSLRSAAKHKESISQLPESSAQSALFQYVLDHGRPKQIWLDEEGDNLAELGLSQCEDDNSQCEEDNAYFEGQEIEHSKWMDFDFRRLALFSAWGFMVSFVQSPWYKFLRTAYSHDAKLVVVVQRVIADQLFYSPTMLCMFLFYLSVVVEKKSWKIIGQNTFWTNFIQILGVNMCVWPIAQFTNFLLIPSPAQIPFSSSLSVLWNTYLSLNTK